MYARLSTVSTSRSPQLPVGSFCRNSAISCNAIQGWQRQQGLVAGCMQSTTTWFPPCSARGSEKGAHLCVLKVLQEAARSGLPC